MKQKKFMTFSCIVFSAVISLTSCGENKPQSVLSAVDSVSNMPESTVSKTNSEFENITVETEKYENEQLTFTYEGKSYTLPLSRDNFKEDIVYYPGSKLHSEQIINNKLGEKVTAVLTVDEGITKIKLCDVIGQNGKVFSNSGGICTMTRTGGSACEFTDPQRTLKADLNDLIVYQKINYPDEVDDVVYVGYLFKDNNFILNQLYVAEYDENGEKNYEEQLNRDLPSFFCTVQTIGDNVVEIKLTDGKTVCTVPTYYCDGELSEGLEVMVILDRSTDLFDSGKSESFDYAVICTDPAEYNASGREFGNLAYAKADSNNLGRFIYTEIGDIEK
ncbi:hypothetical protein [Ruminococcus sp.]